MNGKIEKNENPDEENPQREEEEKIGAEGESVNVSSPTQMAMGVDKKKE